jgi:hypothetical protein
MAILGAIAFLPTIHQPEKIKPFFMNFIPQVIAI